MKYRVFIVLVSAFLFFAVNVPEGASAAEKIPNHPRLYFMKGDEKSVRNIIRADPYWEKLHADIISESDCIISLPLTERYIRDGKRLLSVSRENLRRLTFLSYSYRMTGQKKYLDRAEAELLNICAFTDWNPDHFLDVAEMTMAVSIAYDWLYSSLKETTRAAVREAIIEKALKPSLSRDWFWIKAVNNWNQVCHGGLIAGAVVVYEQETELARNIIDRAVECLPIAHAEYAPAGVYPEGAGYWVYGTTYSVLAIDALKGMFGHDFGLSETPGFMESGFYSQQMEAPGGMRFNYADNGPRSEFGPAPLWFYDRLLDERLVYMQKHLFANASAQEVPRYLSERFLPFAMIWGARSGIRLSEVREPDGLAYMGEGVASVSVMRSSWSDPDALFLGYKNGSASLNHAHMDVGSFFFMADGVRWVLDLGPQSYSEAELAGIGFWNMSQESQRWDVYKMNNFSHSTPTINNRKHNAAGFGRFLDFSDDASFMYALSDITEVFTPWVVDYKRIVAMVDRKYAVVEDIVETGRNFTNVRWNMMTEAESVEELGDNTWIFNKGGKKMYMKVDAPVPVRFYFREARPSFTFEDDVSGIIETGFDIELQRNAVSRIRVYFMPGEPADTSGYTSPIK